MAQKKKIPKCKQVHLSQIQLISSTQKNVFLTNKKY